MLRSTQHIILELSISEDIPEQAKANTRHPSFISLIRQSMAHHQPYISGGSLVKSGQQVKGEIL
jgi:hypothetical protein